MYFDPNLATVYPVIRGHTSAQIKDHIYSVVRTLLHIIVVLC